jgi:DNA-binding GntR family transcriptional regulator
MPKIPRVNVSMAAYASVKQVLLSSKYAPGARVDIDDLCRDLGVSRTPVFDALNRLEAEGLVEIVPRKGVYLVTFSEEKAQELYEVREILEARATKLAAKNLTDKQLEQLKRHLEKQASCLANGDAQGYASATIKFHNSIIEAAGNKTLERLLNAVHSQMEALRLRTLYLPTRLRQSFSEHKKIFEALSKRDPERSERAAREHIVATTEYALQLLRQPDTEAANKRLAQMTA